jgi:hypothetical protein
VPRCQERDMTTEKVTLYDQAEGKKLSFGDP